MEQHSKRVKQQEEERNSHPHSIPIRARPEHLALELHHEVTPHGEASQRQEIQGVYIISVAARLLDMHPQTLRKYERLGLVRPSRTVGMLRLYSERDLKKLRLIRYLETNRGMNLAGVQFILSLLEHLQEMHQRLSVRKNLQAMDAILEKEINRLFRQLNLPLKM